MSPPCAARRRCTKRERQSRALRAMVTEAANGRASALADGRHRTTPAEQRGQQGRLRQGTEQGAGCLYRGSWLDCWQARRMASQLRQRRYRAVQEAAAGEA